MGQQFEFEYAKQAKREGQAINPDPREQTGGSEIQSQPYPTNERAAQPMGGQKIYPQRQRRRRRWLLALVMIVIILALLGGLGALNSTLFARTTALPQQTFNVSGEPQLVVKDPLGSMTIHAGNSHTVVVKATEHMGLLSSPGGMSVTSGQNGNTVDVDVSESGASLLSFESVALDITLPSTSDIQATINAGRMDINGISGLMNFQANAGSIDFENGTIGGNSRFQANAGSIHFHGSLVPDGNYTFNENTGSIDISLPTDSSFILDAKTNVGSVNNDFGSNAVGSHPNSVLHAHADTGSVDIHKG